MLLEGSKVMKITGFEIGTLGRVLLTFQLKYHDQLQVWLVVWSLVILCKMIVP
jgi:hypothetical protein